MEYLIEIDICFFGQKNENADYSVLDDLETQGNAVRENKKFLKVKGKYKVFDAGYSVDHDQKIYKFNFSGISFLKSFLVNQIKYHEAIGIMPDAEYSTVESMIFITKYSDLYDDINKNGGISFLVKNEDIIGYKDFSDALSQMRDNSEKYRLQLEDDMYSAKDEYRERVIKIPDEYRNVEVSEFFPIAREYDIIIGMEANNIISLVYTVLAKFGAKQFKLTTTKPDDEFVSAEYESARVSFDITSSIGFQNYLKSEVKGKNIQFIELSQSFTEWEEMETSSPKIFNEGVQRMAKFFGLCVVVDIPYDEEAGYLVGYMLNEKQSLLPLRIHVEDEDDEESNQ